MRARNAAGLGALSPASSPVVPLVAQAPTAPLIVAATPRDRSLFVAWSAPTDTGGANLSGYTLVATGGANPVTLTPAAGDTSATITGLTNGTTYALTLTAVNTVGISTAATATATPTTAYAPSAPQQFTAVPNAGGTIDLAWQEPADNGGGPVTGYTVSYQRQSRTGTTWAPVANAPVHTLNAAGNTKTATATAFETQQAFYAFTITATTAAGTSTASTGSAPVTPVIATKGGTVTLTPDTLAALTRADDTSLTWTDPAPTQATALTIGNVIAAAPAALLPQGTLRTVTAVSNDGTTLTVSTTTAALGDAFTAMSLAGNLNPAATSAPSGTVRPTGTPSQFTPTSPGVRVLPSVKPADIGAGVGLSDSIKLSYTSKAGGAYITTQASITASIDLQVNVRQNFAGIPNGVSVSATAKAVATASGTIGVKATFSHKLGEYVGAPIDFQIGPVPVIVVPKVVVSVSADGKIGVSFQVTQTTGASVSWDSSKPGDLTTRNLTIGPRLASSPVPGLTATGSLNLGLQIQPQADLYDIGGPNVEGDVDLDTDVNFLPGPGEAFLTTTPSVSLKAGLDLDILGKHASLEATIGTYTFPAFTIKAAPNANYSITPAGAKVNPGGSLQMTATRSDHAAPAVTWGLLGGTTNDRISSTGVLTLSTPPGRGVIVTATDASGATGQVAVTIGTAFDAPGNLQATQTTSDDPNAGLGMTINWTAPANTGGKPLTGYRVVTQPSTGTTTVTDTSTQLGNLKPGTYSVTVYAVNNAGITSAPASTTIYITPRCSSTWNGPDNGNWATATNWLPAGVPGNGSWACLQGHPVTIAKTTNAAVAGLITGGATLTTNGTLTIGTYANITGTLTGTGALTLGSGSSATFAGAVLSGGVKVINQGALSVDGTGNYCGPYGNDGLCLTSGSQLDNQASLTLVGGTEIYDNDGNVGNKITNEASATITAADGTEVNAPLTDAGTITVTTGRLTLDNTTLSGAPVVNGPGNATFGDVTVAAAGATPKLTGPVNIYRTVSGGTLTIPSGSALSLTGAVLAGVTLVNQGALSVDGTGNYCGPYGNDGLCLTSGSQLDNQASLTLVGGTEIYDNDGNVGNKITNEASATITAADGTEVNAPLTDAGTITVTTGRLTLDNTTLSGAPVVNGPGNATFGDVTVAAAGATPKLTGPVNIYRTVSGGTLTIPSGSALSLTGAVLAGVTLVNQGALSVDGTGNYCGPYGNDGLCLTSGSQLDNQASLTLVGGTEIYDNDGNVGNKITNEASATITAADGTEVNAPLTDAGTITVTTGRLTLDNTTLSGAPVVNGPGNATFGDVTVAAAGATPKLTGPVNIYRTVSGGTLTIPSGSALSLTGAVLAGVTLVNKGALSVDGTGNYCGPYGNDGLCLTSGSQLDNQASLTLVGGTEIYDNDGNVGNKITNEASATITAADGTEVNAPLTDAGTITVTTGRLTLDNTTLSGSSVLALGISSSTNGSVSFTSPTRLAGTLALQTAAGYTPKVGRKISLVNAPSNLSGRFTSVLGSQVGSTTWTVTYASSTVTAKATAT